MLGFYGGGIEPNYHRAGRIIFQELPRSHPLLAAKTHSGSALEFQKKNPFSRTTKCTAAVRRKAPGRGRGGRGEGGREEGNPRPARRHHLDSGTANLDNVMATEASLRPSCLAWVCLAMECYGRLTSDE
jgi:hypothetical protein